MKTNEEINALVTEKFMGWTRTTPEMRDRHFYSERWTFIDKNGIWQETPPYATSADAVLPLLVATGHYVWIDHSPETNNWEVELEPKVRTEDGHNFGIADTLPLAACIALLKYKGIEI